MASSRNKLSLRRNSDKYNEINPEVAHIDRHLEVCEVLKLKIPVLTKRIHRSQPHLISLVKKCVH